MLEVGCVNELLHLQGAEDIILALKQATADDMLQRRNSTREDSTSSPQKQATVADLPPPWKIVAVSSIEQPPPQQSNNIMNRSEDTITRGMALIALKQAQQVASEFASLREHVDLSCTVEADGQAMVASRPLPGFRCGPLVC